MAYAGSLQSNPANQMAGASATTPRELTATENIQQAVLAASERLLQLRGRLSDTATRALGSEPEGKADPKPTPVPNGNLAAIILALQIVGSLIEDCHVVATRLDRIA